MYRNVIKPTLDFLTALIAFILLSPLLLLITILLSLTNQGSPFFIQTRPGKNEKPFRLIKFKTMNDQRDAEGHLLPDKDRLTSMGKFVRKTSLDELPQLINVLKGEMSIVGPRPLLVEYLPRYNQEQKRRHEVKPGITGWAQVNGRNAISWEAKFAYDVEYVNNLSFALDRKILWMTMVKVFRSEGISQRGEATMEKFKGSGEFHAKSAKRRGRERRD